jgi:hypothetical protein
LLDPGSPRELRGHLLGERGEGAQRIREQDRMPEAPGEMGMREDPLGRAELGSRRRGGFEQDVAVARLLPLGARDGSIEHDAQVDI